MRLVDNLSVFLSIVKKGSLVAAGKELGLSSTTVSERLAALEAHYGVVLINRTTRSISLTDEGRILAEGAERVLDETEDLESRIRHGARTLSGHIRITAPRDLGQTIIAEEIDAFLGDHPNVSFELLFADGYVDLVSEGIDLAVRFGPVPDTTLRTRVISERHRIVCAAPSYLKRYGTPKKPADLTEHNCLIMRFGADLQNVWRFGSGKAAKLIAVRGDRSANDGWLVRQWCVAGFGLAYKSELDVSADIENGRLVEVLADFRQPPRPMQILFSPSRRQPRRVTVFADRLASALEALA
ncbi:MAG: LysR family transcriptional regulator [Pseudomonadota bacterium]